LRRLLRDLRVSCARTEIAIMGSAAGAAGKREKKAVERLVQAPAPTIKKKAKPAKKSPAKKAEKKSPAKKPEKKEKAKREPSAYNLFMKSELAKVKKANPKMEHKEAFSTAAANWSKQKK